MSQQAKTIQQIQERARQMRVMIIEMLSKAGSGHPGGSLSSADIVATLFFHVLRHKPNNPSWPDRDRFHLSKGHACPVLYSALALSGYFDKKELGSLRQLGALLQGHPDRRTPGVESASGSLGQGLSFSLGMSLAARLNKQDYRVYCLMGDGEMQEGNIWEAAMAVPHFKCDNLCAILDNNGFQIDGKISEVMALESLHDKWSAFGWNVIQVDGHSIEELLDAFEKADSVKGKPTIIIAKTIKGKGVSFMENVVGFHGRAPDTPETTQALDELK